MSYESTSPKPRKIVRQPRYEREIQEIFRTVKRGDEAIRGLEWVVARMPEQGMAVRGAPAGFASWVAHSKEASVQVVYRFDDEAVQLLSARKVPPPGADLERIEPRSP